MQASLFEDEKSQKLKRLDKSLDLIRQKYGYNALKSAAGKQTVASLGLSQQKFSRHRQSVVLGESNNRRRRRNAFVFPFKINSASSLCDCAMEIYDSAKHPQPIRLLSVSAFDLSSGDEVMQASLFEDEKSQKLKGIAEIEIPESGDDELYITFWYCYASAQ